MTRQSLGDDETRGRDYLAVLAGLAGIDHTDQPLRALIRDRLGLTEAEEQRLISRSFGAIARCA
jgi:hypothetical protein